MKASKRTKALGWENKMKKDGKAKTKKKKPILNAERKWEEYVKDVHVSCTPKMFIKAFAFSLPFYCTVFLLDKL